MYHGLAVCPDIKAVLAGDSDGNLHVLVSCGAAHGGWVLRE